VSAAPKYIFTSPLFSSIIPPGNNTLLGSHSVLTLLQDRLMAICSFQHMIWIFQIEQHYSNRIAFLPMLFPTVFNALDVTIDGMEEG